MGCQVVQNYNIIEIRQVFLQVIGHRLHERAGLDSGESASYQCVPGSIPGLYVTCGISLLVLYPAPRGFPRWQ